MLRFLRNLREKHDLKTLIFYSSWSLTLTSGLSYLFGFLRDRVFAQTFGLSRTLDIYNSAFVLPDLLQSLLIGTALSAAFVPIFSKQYDQEKSLGYVYAHQVMSWGVTLIIVAGIFCAIFLPQLSSYLVPGFSGEDLDQYILITRILLLSPIIFAISTTYGQVLISQKDFFWYGISPALYNIGIILGAIILAPYLGILGLVIGTLFGAILHMINRLLAVRRQKFELKVLPDYRLSPQMQETFVLAFPKFLQYGANHLMLLVFTSTATLFSAGSVAAYNYARNFQSLPVSLLGIAIALAMYPALSHDAGKGNFEKFKKDFKKNRFRSLFYTTLAAIALALLAPFMVKILLGGRNFDAADIQLVATVLMVYCISIPLESLMHIYHRAYYSLLNTLIPSLMHAVTIFLTIYLALDLSRAIHIPTLRIDLWPKMLVENFELVTQWLPNIAIETRAVTIDLLPSIGVYAIPVSFAAGLALHITVLATVFPHLLKKREREATVEL